MISVLVQRNTYPFDAEGRPIPVDIEIAFSEMEWNRRVYPAEWNGVEHIIRSGWSGKLLITGSTIPWSLYDVFGHRCGLNLYNVERRSKPWDGTIECTAMATVYDVDFPNIAFVARMQGRLNPNVEAIR
ncbi:MAG: hypothetical protein EOP83_35460 [Verrucomicrobiaceae bacterium]|nr:MAG: hypothetical protein EOP83_35460 [Verrucomicrobiaceae bacterium]